MDHPDASQTRALSERLYRLLLLAYPRAFREEYGAEMLLAFRDAYDEASCERGAAGALNLWSEMLYDVIKTVCVEHVRSWTERDGREIALSGKERLAMALPFTLRVAQHTDAGQARPTNEDRFISLVPEDNRLAQARGALFVVSDGMGGRGDVASEMVIQQVKDHYYQNLQDDIPTALRKAIKQAGDAIRQANEAERIRGADESDMGATCVAAVLHEQSLYVANIGDSRAYVMHAGQLRQVTRDHSLVAQLVERGALTPAEARAHPQRSLIYRALGLPDAEADLFIEPIQETDTLILCSDGLCSVVEDEELRAIVEHDPPEESVRHLIARANARGGPDNITAIVARVS